ncbi:hypothetical protein KC19_7G084500 [Ceratodon purpureus]|uniref:G-patch domain-containing protein n=1 Tax=Ceratodon purpureus TaxID=3225 RepID=A0A8T0H5Y5_CERPU|nr:hypothetical protein KC19_7G084500 [Ceratodon purpureus]
MAVSLRGNSSAVDRISFVRGGEQVSVSRKRKGDVNTADGVAGFTAEESSSFYGNLVGLPENVRLRGSFGGDSNWGLSGASGREEAGGDGGGRWEPSGSGTSANLSESNIGFQLLKKSGWKEGTGLGATEQGRLDPVKTHFQPDRRGIGADVKKKKVILSSEERRSQKKTLKETEGGEKKKVLTKKARKALAKAEREREQAVAAAFYREFWPENV